MSPRPVAVVLGARGLVGSALTSELGGAGWRIAAAASHAECDITDAGAVRALVGGARPTVVFNAAAYNDLEGAERAPDFVHAVNATGAENVAAAAADVGAAVVHYSTDFVFDGTAARPYDERDPPSPQGCYARAKAAGDRLVAAANPRHFILRVGCLFGHGGRNFPSAIVRRLRAGETIRADAERLASPTWVREVAAVSAALAATPHPRAVPLHRARRDHLGRLRARGGRAARPPERPRRGGHERPASPRRAASPARDPRQPRAARARPRHAVAVG